MKQVFETYARAILAVMVAAFLLQIFTLIWTDMEVFADTLLEERRIELGENQAFEEHMTKMRWRIALVREYDVRTKNTYLVDSLWRMIDPSGVECKILAASGYLENDESVEIYISADQKSITATLPGVYLVKIGAYSTEYGYYETQVRLLINGEEEV